MVNTDKMNEALEMFFNAYCKDDTINCSECPLKMGGEYSKCYPIKVAEFARILITGEVAGHSIHEIIDLLNKTKGKSENEIGQICDEFLGDD